MNNILDDDIYDDGRESLIQDELLAEGEYESNSETILKGFRIFQKHYVYKNVALQMMLVILGLASQIFAIFTAQVGEDVSISYFLVVACVLLGAFVLLRPRNTLKNLEKSIKELDGTVYSAEIYTDKVKIETISDNLADDDAPAEEEKTEKLPDDEPEDDEGIPATIIHLDNSSVELLDAADIFVVYIKKVNMFVIPKSAFKPYEVTAIRDRLSNIMGVRYKENA